jgi:hypothetical protein
MNIQPDFKKFYFMDDNINYALYESNNKIKNLDDKEVDNFKIMNSLNLQLNKGIFD